MMPDKINTSHNLVVVASELDDASERIINYLSSEDHRVSINAVFFKFFQDPSGELVGRAWLMDPAETKERSESRKHAPWPGDWFVNVGDGRHRNWDDNVKYNYIGAGHGEYFSRQLLKLKARDKFFAYMKGRGYVGYGQVTREAVPIGQFIVDDLNIPLLDVNPPLHAPNAGEDKDSPELREWCVGVKWLKHYPREQAKSFKGIFANQAVVCKLREPKTLEFLRAEFGWQGEQG